MYSGKTVFAQLMDCLPWSTFSRLVTRYGGDYDVRTFPCVEQYRAMAFAQLTYRESLRDIEACLSAQPAKLYHMGFRGPIRRSTLADANETRDWRIYAEFAQRLIAQARRLYVGETLSVDLKETVYALDSTTIDLCLSLFPWAHFRSTKAAVKMHTLLDLRGNIPSFIHIPDGKLHDVHALDMLVPEAGAIYVMDRGYVDFARLHGLHQAGAFFVTRAKSNLNAHRMYSAPTDRTTGVIADQKIALDGHYTRKDYPFTACALQRPGNQKGARVSYQSDTPTGIDDLRPIQMPLAGGAFLQVDQAKSPDQEVLWDVRECSEDPDMDRRVGLRTGRHRPQAVEAGRFTLHIDAGVFGDSIRKGFDTICYFPIDRQFR